MRARIVAVAAAAGLFLPAGITAVHAQAGASLLAVRPGPVGTAVVVGTGHAVARSVTVSRARRSDRKAAPVTVPGPLARAGGVAGATLPVRANPGTRTLPAGRAATGRHLVRTAREAAPPRPLPGLAVRASSSANPANFAGISEGSSDCPNCQTPDVSATLNSTEIAETTNLLLQVYSKSTAATLCTVSLSSLLGAATGLSRPRIQYDNASQRFSLVVDSVPSSSSDVPVQYLATSQTDDACGAWWVYSLSFPVSSLYPLGSTLDYPYLGQDSTSILSSTNNFGFSGSYLGSAAYAIPKAAAYTGAGFSFTTYAVAFSTAPVTVAGIPTFSTTTTYWLAAVPGTGYDLYAMPTSPAGPITLQAVIKASFSAPSRRVNQPGTSQTLDPLDGRIESAPVQDGSNVWFANGVDDDGFPTIRYGAINVQTDHASTALAFHGDSSDDFNPSIGVSDVGGTRYIWVNWAYTIASAGVPVSDTVAGVTSGQGISELAGDDLTLVTGASSGSISSFGGYSSTAADPVAEGSCPAGLTALTAQEYFSSGTWTTRLARTTFC